MKLEKARSLFASLTDFCVLCERRSKPLVMPSICGRCLSQLPFRPRHIPVSFASLSALLPAAVEKQIVCPFYYVSEIQEAILRMKFAGRWHTARALGPLLANAVKRQGVSAELIVPLPLHKARRKQRGYNQAERLAYYMADALSLPICDDLLRRDIDTPRQSEASGTTRFKEVLNAFVVKDSTTVKERSIYLVDDVLTTGATLFAASKKLALAGFRVQAVVLASNQGKPRI